LRCSANNVRLAPNAAWVLVARLSDRLGKRVRDAARDALVANQTPQAQRAQPMACGNRSIPSAPSPDRSRLSC
jgi:hypothetical protein